MQKDHAITLGSVVLMHKLPSNYTLHESHANALTGVPEVIMAWL